MTNRKTPRRLQNELIKRTDFLKPTSDSKTGKQAIKTSHALVTIGNYENLTQRVDRERKKNTVGPSLGSERSSSNGGQYL
jgi:hypothetical protein